MLLSNVVSESRSFPKSFTTCYGIVAADTGAACVSFGFDSLSRTSFKSYSKADAIKASCYAIAIGIS